MSREVHYEIFRRQGSKGGWVMHEATNLRDAAIAAAQALMADNQATGVKVVKESFDNETGAYQSLKIFEDGHNKMKEEVAKEDAPSALPCFKPDDLYSYHARSTMGRLLAEHLARQRITITELIHRGDALEQLEATGTTYQHAIQKVSVAQAASTQLPVQQIVKKLQDLTTKAMNRVYNDEKSGYFPQVREGQFAALAHKLAQESDKSYLFNGAIAHYLADASGWNEKLSRLLAILNEAEKNPDVAEVLLGTVDSIGAEILAGSAALHELIGQTENLGAAIWLLVHIFLGEKTEGANTAIASVTRHFKTDDLPAARTAVAGRILAELKSVKRLCPDSLVDELKTLRRIANKLVLGQGKYLSHEDLIGAFTLRSKRLVTNEMVSEHLQEAGGVNEKIERLLLIEENIIGAENKRQLAKFFPPIITSPPFEQFYLFAKTPVLERLQNLVELQKRVNRSGFQDVQKQEICDALDKVACEVESRAKLLDSIESRPAGAIEKSIAILRLITGGAITEGQLSERARNLVLTHMGKPGFMTGYATHLAKAKGETPSADVAMNDLMQTLEKAGIGTEAGLRALAA
jgi:hypothetical protein